MQHEIFVCRPGHAIFLPSQLIHYTNILDQTVRARTYVRVGHEDSRGGISLIGLLLICYRSFPNAARNYWGIPLSPGDIVSLFENLQKN